MKKRFASIAFLMILLMAISVFAAAPAVGDEDSELTIGAFSLPVVNATPQNLADYLEVDNINYENYALVDSPGQVSLLEGVRERFSIPDIIEEYNGTQDSQSGDLKIYSYTNIPLTMPDDLPSSTTFVGVYGGFEGNSVIPSYEAFTGDDPTTGTRVTKRININGKENQHFVNLILDTLNSSESVEAQYSSNINFVNCDFNGGDKGSTENNSGITVESNTSNLNIKDCHFRNFSWEVIPGVYQGSGVTTLTREEIGAISITDSVFYNCGEGIHATNTEGFRINNNHFIYNKKNNLRLDFGDTTEFDAIRNEWYDTQANMGLLASGLGGHEALKDLTLEERSAIWGDAFTTREEVMTTVEIEAPAELFTKNNTKEINYEDLVKVLPLWGDTPTETELPTAANDWELYRN